MIADLQRSVMHTPLNMMGTEIIRQALPPMRYKELHLPARGCVTDGDGERPWPWPRWGDILIRYVWIDVQRIDDTVGGHVMALRRVWPPWPPGAGPSPESSRFGGSTMSLS